MYGYELDELLKQHGLSNPSNAYGGTPMPTGTTIDPLQQAAYEADQAKYQDYLKEYTNRLQNTNMYSAPQFQSPATYSDLYKKQVGNSVVPQVGTPAYENYVKSVNETLKNNPTTTQPELVALMDKYGQNRYDLVNATGSWWGDVLGNPNYQNYKAPETKPVIKDTVTGGAISDITVTPPIFTNNETIKGGTGNDSITGGAGNDTVTGGAGTSAGTVTGGLGNDTITGGTGVGTVTGGAGNDTVTGGSGTAIGTITGGTGNDTITGGSGTAIGTITGGTGNDTITGGTGTGTSGTGTVTGGTGNDTVTGGTGSGVGTITGGVGNDVSTVTGGTGVDTTMPTVPTDDFGNPYTKLPVDPNAKPQNPFDTRDALGTTAETNAPTNNVMGPISNNPNQAPQTVTLNDLVSANPATSPATGPYTLEQQKAIDDAIAKAKTDAATKAANDFVGPVSNNPNQAPQTVTLNDLVSKYNDNQTGPYAPEQQKVIDNKTQVDADALAKQQAEALANALADAAAKDKAAYDAKVASDALAKQQTEQAQAKANAEQKALAEKAALSSQSNLEASAQNAGYSGDLTDTAAMQRYLDSQNVSVEDYTGKYANQQAIDKAAAEQKAIEDARIATEKATADALAKQQADELAKSLDAAKQTTADLANKYNINQISSDNLTFEKNPNQATVEQQGPYTPEQQKEIADAKAKVEQAAIDAAETAEIKRIADEKAAIDRKIAEEAQKKADEAAKIANDFVGPVSNDGSKTSSSQTVTIDDLASKYNKADLSQQMGPYTPEQQKAIDAANEADRVAKEAQDAADKSAREAKIAADKAAADEKVRLENEKKAIEKAAKEKAQADAIEKQKALDEAAKANPTIENIAAKYNISTLAATAAKAIADGMDPDKAFSKYYLQSGDKDKSPYNHMYELSDAFRNDLPADKVPTVSELAQHYKVSENSILAALLLNSDVTQKQLDDFVAKNPFDTYAELYAIPDLASAIRTKLGSVVQNAAAKAKSTTNTAIKLPNDTTGTVGADGSTGSTGSTGSAGATGSTSSTTNTIVPNSSGGLTSTTPITQPATQPQTLEAVKQITEAATLANKIVQVTKDTPNPITPKDAKTIAIERVTYPKEKLKDFTEQTLLDSLGDFSKMIMPGPAYVLDSLGNIVQGQAPMDPIDWARSIYSKDPSINVSSLVPDFMKDWANADTTASTNNNTSNTLNSGHLLELSAPKDGSEAVAVIKVPTTDSVTEKFADVIQNNLANPEAIQKYAKDNNLGDAALTKAVQFAKDNAASIKQFNEAAANAQANGTLQNGKIIGSELFPTTIAAIDALVDGAVPFSLGVPLIAEIKSLINGTNYDDALAQEYNDFNHWAAANPIQTKVLQTLGVIGASELTGGLGPFDSMKVNNIWNQDLGINARSIAVNLNDKGPITATPIDSKGNAIGETITLNKDSLPTNFFDTIGTNVSKSYNDLIGSIEGTIGSIGDFLSGGDNEQLPNDFEGSITYPNQGGTTTTPSTGNEIYDNAIKGLSDLWGNKAFSSLGTLSPSADWSFNSSNLGTTPGYADLSSPSFWGSSLGNFDNSNFGDWGGGGIPSGWSQSDFGFNGGAGWGDAGGGWDMQLAKGGAVSKEIDRLYKKYGGAV